jgi:GWxTD domain-containing protein
MTALQIWIGTALVHFIWEGAAIAAIFAIVLASMRGASSRARYGFACCALFAMPIAFTVTLAFLMPHSGRAFAVAVPLDFSSRIAMVAGQAAAPAWNWTMILRWAVPAWMAGVAALLIYRLASWIAAQRLKRMGTSAAPAEWTRHVIATAGRLGIRRRVALVESVLAEVPMVIGYLRPVVLAPIGMLAGLPIDQVEAILLHELAHVRRADYLVNLLQTMIESMLFYHPAVWWISSVVRAERENCCDDFVLAGETDPQAYASALVALEQSRASGMVLAANDGDLVRRVRRMLRSPAARESSIAIGPVALAILGAGVVFGAYQSQVARPVAPQYQTIVAQAGAILSQQQTILTQAGAILSEYHTTVAPQLVAQAQPERRSVQAAQPKQSPFSRWLNEDVSYIITQQERDAWDRLQADDEREQFVEQFWARRDPTPGTDANEYREEHYRRIAYVNGRFGFADHAGWTTDRGRIYITYGPPDEIETHSQEHREKWFYRYIEGMGSNIIIEFVDPSGAGEYRMTPDSQLMMLRAQIAATEIQLRDAREKSSEGRADVQALMDRLRRALERLRTVK